MRRITVRGIIWHNNKLLCMRLKPYRLANRDFWCVPGGGVDEGEALLPALDREMIEETGVKPEIGNLLYIQQYIDGDDKQTEEQLEFFFHIKNSQDYLNVDLTKTTHGQEEIETLEFVDPKTVNLLPKFLKEESITEDIQLSGTAKIYSFMV